MQLLNIIVAAGVGSRFGADRPKQFCPLTAHQTVLAHAVARLRQATNNAPTVVVVSPGFEHEVPEGCIIAYGGATRRDSVSNALAASAHIEAEAILVHDGARPLPSRRMIADALEALAVHQGAIPVVGPVDSLRRRSTGAPEDRADICCVQTPQVFRASLLRRAYSLTAGQEGFTDDASVMTAAGFTDICLTPGYVYNLKITHPLDLEIARLYLSHDA